MQFTWCMAPKPFMCNSAGVGVCLIVPCDVRWLVLLAYNWHFKAMHSSLCLRLASTTERALLAWTWVCGMCAHTQCRCIESTWCTVPKPSTGCVHLSWCWYVQSFHVSYDSWFCLLTTGITLQPHYVRSGMRRPWYTLQIQGLPNSKGIRDCMQQPLTDACMCPSTCQVKLLLYISLPP